MRILHLIHTPRHSGAEILVRDLCLIHQNGGDHCAIASFEPEQAQFSAETERLKASGIKLFFPAQSLRRYARIKHFKTAIAQYKPDVVIAHSVLPSLYGRVSLSFLRRSRPRFVTVLHAANNDDFKSPAAAFAEHLLRGRNDKIVTVSEEGRLNYLGRFGQDSPVERISNGIDINRFMSADRESNRQLLKICGTTKVIVQVGRIDGVKQQYLSVRSLAPLLRGGGLELWFAGLVEDKAYEAELRKLIKHEGVENQVRFLGSRNDIPQILAAADLYVMPSRAEAHSIALLEALASGIPMVVSDIPVFQFVKEMQGVALIGIDNCDEMAKACKAMLEIRRPLRDVAEFDIGITAERYKSLISRDMGNA